tara:strand:- start:53 stop:979 length:927 start_codon:yes stop_codon:yes gene_type:complete
LKKFKIGITGASGLIGSKLCEFYSSHGHEVSIITRAKRKINFKNLKIYETDLSNPDIQIIKKFTKNIDFLFHLASELKDDSKMVSTNYESTKLFVDILVNTKTTLVYMSSIGVFDFNFNKVITEHSEKKQINKYEKTKFLSEKYIYGLKKKLKFIIIRPSIILDLKMKSNIIKNLIALNSLKIRPKISHSVLANFVLSSDVINALIELSKEKKSIGESFNISSNVYLAEFMLEISNITNKKPYISIPFNIFLILIKIISFMTNRRNVGSLIVFFSNTSRVSSEKIENFLDLKISRNFSHFLKKYIEKK